MASKKDEALNQLSVPHEGGGGFGRFLGSLFQGAGLGGALAPEGSISPFARAASVGASQAYTSAYNARVNHHNEAIKARLLEEFVNNALGVQVPSGSGYLGAENLARFLPAYEGRGTAQSINNFQQTGEFDESIYQNPAAIGNVARQQLINKGLENREIMRNNFNIEKERRDREAAAQQSEKDLRFYQHMRDVHENNQPYNPELAKGISGDAAKWYGDQYGPEAAARLGLIGAQTVQAQTSAAANASRIGVNQAQQQYYNSRNNYQVLLNKSKALQNQLQTLGPTDKLMDRAYQLIEEARAKDMYLQIQIPGGGTINTYSAARPGKDSGGNDPFADLTPPAETEPKVETPLDQFRKKFGIK